MPLATQHIFELGDAAFGGRTSSGEFDLHLPNLGKSGFDQSFDRPCFLLGLLLPLLSSYRLLLGLLLLLLSNRSSDLGFLPSTLR